MTRSRETIVSTCAALGIECETGDLEPGGFVDLMLDEVLALPSGVERLSAILAVNDGSSVEDRASYRPSSQD